MAPPKLFFSIGLFLVPAGFLVPNHYLPWPSFAGETLAIGAFFIAALAALNRAPASPWPNIGLLFAALAIVPVVQGIAGLIFFGGDAVVAASYIALFALSISVGRTTADRYSPERVLDPLMIGIAVAGAVSAGICLYQWLRFSGLGAFAADLPAGARPYANLGQPNLLATLEIMSLVSAHYLYQRSLLPRAGMIVLSVVFCAATAMTQSRTAWIQLSVYLIYLAVSRSRGTLRIGLRTIAGTALGFAAFAFAWPSLCEALYLSVGRTLGDQASAGTRWVHWASLLDALGRAPLLGYGWNQVAVAQARTAADYPWTGEFIEHSHDLVLDLLIWNGIPLGVCVIGAFVWWIAHHVRRTRSPLGHLVVAAILVVLVHALLEFPLEFAGFLIPFGLFMGILESIDRTPTRFEIRRSVQAAMLVSSLALFSWIAIEYVEVEANNRILRLEAARIGTAKIVSQAPDVILLTQQREFLRYARTEATRGMSPQDLDWMRKVSERFGYAPSLFRYALAAGINGQPDAARNALARLCKTQAIDRCVEGRDAWATMATGRYPELASIQYPPVPTGQK